MTTKPNSPLSVDKMLLCGIGAIIIVLLIVLILKNPPPPHEKDTPLSDGKTATREELVKEGAKPTKPQTVGDEKRCKEVAQAGKTYKTRVTAEVAGRAEDKAWGVKTVVNITYASEALVNRTIEENDGRTLVVT